MHAYRCHMHMHSMHSAGTCCEDGAWFARLETGGLMVKHTETQPPLLVCITAKSPTHLIVLSGADVDGSEYHC